MDFKESRTRENLMRAFAGESQARNRYTFAAELAQQNGLFVVKKFLILQRNRKRNTQGYFTIFSRSQKGRILILTLAILSIHLRMCLRFSKMPHTTNLKKQTVHTKSLGILQKKRDLHKLQVSFILLLILKKYMESVLMKLQSLWNRASFCVRCTDGLDVPWLRLCS